MFYIEDAVQHAEQYDPTKIRIVIDRVKANHDEELISKLGDSVATAFNTGNGACDLVISQEGQERVEQFSSRFELDGMQFEQPSEHMFSFNNPMGACPRCEGYGKVTGIETNTGKTFHGPVILATGHSARDVYRCLYANGVYIEPKGIAVGVRLEHPSMLIDQIQYHNKAGRGKYLPAAEYSFVQQVDGRGVYSFCMCPGGFVVPAASGPHQIVVNGMSPSNRGTKWSNSGMVVELRTEDLAHPDLQLQACEAYPGSAEAQTEALITQAKTEEGTVHPLAMMRFQEKLEQICWQQGNMRQTAPAQRMVDFTRKKLSFDLPSSSYSPGLISSPLHFWMPKFISDRLDQGFQLFGKSSRGFLTNDAVMIAVETRTSAPVRITRDAETLQHIEVEGLFPCGEGAGYAGGIVSAGIDGERCAEAVAGYLHLSPQITQI